MKLSDAKVRNAKPGPVVQRFSDGHGLFLKVKTNGTKTANWNYRHDGKQKTASYGVYPEVSLAQAREKHMEARKLLKSGINPVHHAREMKKADGAVLTARSKTDDATFEVLRLSFQAKWTREKASHNPA
ncbi:DUF4102 domain-containing protein [Aliiroseovarius sp. Z3]|uniref:Arm DNA-binding domain-containing protein n=1 Tax=Aliiroseovarius sp. Z3 TaxID=2811402 RepID=UPI0023B26666|nr:Arm DNA-binding domain-containing protein [Aliiroseovarius sp. Z3]MDE9449922.1 DUF4102 domain-containing protein [Aliiroseovarius sp. Z3]